MNHIPEWADEPLDEPYAPWLLWVIGTGAVMCFAGAAAVPLVFL